ncbi:hypothetical protein J7643_14300 [bacterium]|nr:hypothetical protein [bacterium]
MKNRSPFVAVLALSLATVSGCAALPGNLLAARPEAATTAQALSSLKLLVDSGAYRAQAVDLSAIAIHVRLEFPYQSDASPRTLDVQSGVPAVFGDLAPGHALLTVSAQNVVTNQLIDTQSRWVDLLPGVQAAAQFALTVGGSTAADVGVTFGANTRDYRTFDQPDGLDPDFRAALGNGQFMPGRRVLPFQLETPEGTSYLTFTTDADHLERQIAHQPSVSYPSNAWYQLPGHAVRVDSEPLLGQTKVRHFRWSNEYEANDERRLYTFDRWVTPLEGTIKETVSENGVVRSTLSRTPVRLAGMLLRGSDPLTMPFPLGLKRWDGEAFVPAEAGTARDEKGNTLFFGVTPGRYQVVYDASTGFMDPSLAARVVSAPVQVSDMGQASFGLDVGWELRPSIGPTAKREFVPGFDAFAFAPKSGAPDAEYQVVVASASYTEGRPTYQPVWSSAWGPAGSVAWNGKAGEEVSDPVGVDAPTGDYAYHVRFRKQGTAFGGEGSYGQSHWQSFRLMRAPL